MSDLSDQQKIRRERLENLRKAGQAYPNGFEPKNLARPLHQEFDEIPKDQLDPKGVPASVAGRVMAVRAFGKAAFVTVQDRTGRIQLYVQKKKLGDEAFAAFQEFDIGDILFAEGTMFKTKTNELSVDCTKVQLVSKSLHPLPEKFHGLSDIETRYRQRYLDLMTSEESRKVFQVRSKIIEEFRKFFLGRDFIEVETPMMHPIAGGAVARPFKTFHNTLQMDLFLRIAPELYLKRLVVGGFERVFEINRNFRNEGISIKHNPEFTMLEFYQAWATFEDLMPLTEQLFQQIAKAITGGQKVTYQDKEINFGGNWERISVEDSILKYSGFKTQEKLRDRKALLEYGKKKNLPMDPKVTTGELLMVIFDEEVESQLIQPTFVTHYPLDVSPLSRKNDKDPFLVDRFELFIYGREMANGFSELNDPDDQRSRFEAQVEAKKAGNPEACEMDDDYVRALEFGMPPTAGEGVGIDRTVMLFTDSPSIRDVILFPQLRKQ